MRRFGIEAAEDAADFGELVHQLPLVLQAARGVDDQDVDPFGRRAFDRIEHDPCRIAAFGAGDDRYADPVRPHLQLANGGSTECVAGREHDTIILFEEKMCELCNGRRLARAVDADNQNDLRPGERVDVERFRHGRKNCRDLILDNLPDTFGVYSFFEASGGNLFTDLRGHCRPQVRRDQRVFNFIQIPGVQFRLGHQTGDIVGQLARSLFEAAE